MNLEAERKFKFDRRLRGRDGWVSEEEFQAELDSLPDSASKIYTPEDERPSETPVADAPAER